MSCGWNFKISSPRASGVWGHNLSFFGVKVPGSPNWDWLERREREGATGYRIERERETASRREVQSIPSGKSKWGLSQWELKVLVHIHPRLPTIVVILRRKFPLERGAKGPQKCTIVDDCAQIAESGLKPPFESPCLDSPNPRSLQEIALIFKVNGCDVYRSQKNARSCEAPRCSISLRSKIASEQRFSVKVWQGKRIPTAEIPCDTSSVVKNR